MPSPPEPPINPYESPQTPVEGTNGSSWASPNRQQIGLAWLWMSLGGITLLLAFGMHFLFIIAALLGLAWIIAGCGTLFRPQRFIPFGLIVNHLVGGMLLCCGLLAMFLSPDMGWLICLVMLLLIALPVWLSAKARVVLDRAKQIDVSPEHGEHET